MNPPVADRELEEAASAVESSARPAPPAATEPIKARIVGLQGYGFVSLALVSVIAALSLAQGFFIPVVVSVVIALALSRVVRRLSRWMPRWIASGLVVGFLLGGLGTLGYGLSDEGTRAIAGLPSATKSLRQAFRVMTNRQQGPLSQVQRAIDELERTASESTNRPATPSGVTPVQVIEPPIDVSNVVWLGSQGMLGVVAQLTLVVFLVYFLLTYGELFKRKIVRLSGASLARRKVTVQLIDEIGENVAKSISHLVLVSVVVGVATSGSLMLLDVRYAGLWGLAAGDHVGRRLPVHADCLWAHGAGEPRRRVCRLHVLGMVVGTLGAAAGDAASADHPKHCGQG